MVAIELTTTISLQITDTVPRLKSASATSCTKPDTLITGTEAQVPEHIENGEVVKIITSTDRFASRD
ncbi:MAG: hypothetical protein A6F72_08050 [Cycloclasticus sp. symbiont of Poecilosclerida sp. N]|nr:MAG: hypothetical protein A6F72_08050 [Cycloclasticus sp. symbiont of Poecilosclerida sp. N]